MGVSDGASICSWWMMASVVMGELEGCIGDEGEESSLLSFWMWVNRPVAVDCRQSISSALYVDSTLSV